MKKVSTKKTKKINKLDQTEIVVVLDRSGSMGSIAVPTVEGFNKFLNEQQNALGEAFITLVQFDDQYEVNYKSMPVKDASPLILGESFKPRGSTALLDAIGKTIEELKTDKDVVFVIITDGEENASKVYKNEAINKMITTLTKEGWKFIFLAANQDAIAKGGAMGIHGSNSMTYAATTRGASRAFATISANTANYRNSKSVYLSQNDVDTIGSAAMDMLSMDISFTDAQKDEQKKEGA